MVPSLRYAPRHNLAGFVASADLTRFAWRAGSFLHFLGIRVAQMPKPFVRGDKAFHVPAARAVRGQRAAGQHHLQNVQQLFRNLKIALIAGMMERDQNFVGQTSAVARSRA